MIKLHVASTIYFLGLIVNIVFACQIAFFQTITTKLLLIKIYMFATVFLLVFKALY